MAKKKINPDLARTALGMNQELMAGYLGVNRVVLAMAEKGKRGLSTTALHRWRYLETIVSAPNEAADLDFNAIVPLIEERNAVLQKKMAKAERDLKLQRKKLVAIEQDYAAFIKATQRLPVFARPVHSTSNDNFGVLKLAEEDNQLRQKIAGQLYFDIQRWGERCHPSKQALIKLKIAGLEAEISAAERIAQNPL